MKFQETKMNAINSNDTAIHLSPVAETTQSNSRFGIVSPFFNSDCFKKADLDKIQSAEEYNILENC